VGRGEDSLNAAEEERTPMITAHAEQDVKVPRIKGTSQWRNGEFWGIVRVVTFNGIGLDEDLSDELANHFSYYSVKRSKGDDPRYINHVHLPLNVLSTLEKIKDTPFFTPGLKTAIHCALVWSAEYVWNHHSMQHLRRVYRDFKSLKQQGTPLEEFTASVFRMNIVAGLENGRVIRTIPVSDRVHDVVCAMQHEIGLTQSDVVNICFLYYLSRQEKAAESYRQEFRTKLERIYETVQAKAESASLLLRKLAPEYSPETEEGEPFMIGG
jgi:hypothetical protein